MMWHMVQISASLDQEFASALSNHVPLTAWSPRMSLFGSLCGSRFDVEQLLDPPLKMNRFPLQRRYNRPWVSFFARAARKQMERMLAISPNAQSSPLICTTPYWADLAELWPGPVVYYLTDLIAAYEGADEHQVYALDRRMCAAATLVCPNSRRLSDYLQRMAGCDPGRIEIVPNATRESNLFAQPPNRVSPLPADIADLPRPVVGIIGNLSSNMDWVLLQKLVRTLPDFSWAFVGPTDMKIHDSVQAKARRSLQGRGGRVRFTGGKSYGDLAQYAKSFDVALLPYFRREPTMSGSSTRFYEHLAACRPMIGMNFAELREKPPLLRYVNSADECAEALVELKRHAFEDGYTADRWLASKNGTWTRRATQVVRALRMRARDHRETSVSTGICA